MRLPLRDRAYLWSTVACAVGTLVVWVQAWHGGAPSSLVMAALLAALGVICIHFHLTVTPRHRISLSPAVYFAALLLVGVPWALAIVAGSRLIGEATLSLRRNPVTGRRRRDLLSMLFNVSQLTVATGAGGLAYYMFLPEQVPAPLARLENLWALPLSAAAMFAVSTAAAAGWAAVHTRRSPIALWLGARRRDGFHPLLVYALGVITAAASIQFPWTPLLMVVPAAIVYTSLRRMFNLVLVEQTVGAVEAMADIVDMRDAYTFDHSKRVAEYAVLIGRQMGLAAEEVETIRLAARVHDLGKIGVPDRILLKEGPLEPAERRQVEKHPEIGYQVLSRFPEYRHGKELVLSHHERFDGQGYPNRLSGRRLPLGAQVIAVADALDAMTSDRPYRPAHSLEDALAVFRRGKGTEWHPEVVQALELLAAQGQLPNTHAGRRTERPAGATNGRRARRVADLPIRLRLAEKLAVRPSSLETLDFELASTILASLEKMDHRLKKLDQEAAVDELTGVLRRRAGLAALEREVARAHRTPGGALSLAFLDVNGLKEVNDGQGHAAGDQLLRRITDALRENLRRQDLVFRYGGDEFVCVLTDVGFAAAWEKLSQIRAQLRQDLGQEPFSIGLAALREGETGDQLVARADGALYAERRIRRGLKDKAAGRQEHADRDEGEWLVIERTLGTGAGGG